MLVSDIIADAQAATGICDSDILFRRITDAVKLLQDKGITDLSLGEMDLCVCNGCVTLPRDVGTVLQVNVGGGPSYMRDQWYQYHLNGTGSTGCTPCGFTDELGRVSTYKDPSMPVKLAAVLETASDNSKKVRVYGWDEDGKRIFSTAQDGTIQDGFFVPTIYGSVVPNPNVPDIARIDRVDKDVTVGFIKLLAFNPDTNEVDTTIGYYQPTETYPSYRRIRVSSGCWARIKYKRADFEVRSLLDWVNVENRLALILALRAIKFKLDGAYDLAASAEQQAVALLNSEAEAKRPPSAVGPQIVRDVWLPDNDRLFY